MTPLNRETDLVETLQRPAVPSDHHKVTAAPGRGPALKSYAVFGVILSVLFSRNLIALATYAAHSTLDSYILLIPFIVAYLLWPRLRLAPSSSEGGTVGAILFLLAGFAALSLLWTRGGIGWPATQNDRLTLATFAYVSFWVAGGLVFMGSKWMSALAFPAGFLFFLVPLPEAVVAFLERASQGASAEAAELFFNLSGLPALRDGYVFQLPGITIRVAQECSGIHSSLVLFIASVLCAQLFLKSPYRRAFLILFIFPLGILRNGFRIFVIGWLCTHVGPQMIHSPIHHQGGPLFFALSLVPLFFVLRWLSRAEMPRPQRAQATS
jgi:exosortase C (VPDSG-CTERM-specific)